MVGESEPNDGPKCRVDDGTSITGDVVSLSILVQRGDGFAGVLQKFAFAGTVHTMCTSL